ncbi:MULTISPECIES: hypothetical protein [Parabacteroides]|jgi:hypothetical protein|uniref:Uncharacterized protein n=1 Tax=Siphoviridae sp. ct7aK2 TaxID=2825351 RepID=A0A8S5U9M3_9CAUD|nr:hypothetical protein [Parabacteroides goldsteinii]DAF91078.1 MAG TPA: hypothetical protein [Siphoviridae sp. ct7aK2]
MKRYRIIKGSGYNGCIPITVYWVQVYRESFWGGKYVSIKGFDTYTRAKELYDLLNN